MQEGVPVYPAGVKGWGRYWCMWGWNELEWVDIGAVGCAGCTNDCGMGEFMLGLRIKIEEQF